MSIRINVEKKPGEVYTFTISGSVDSDTYKNLEDKINPVLNSETKVIIFDMEGVEYMSSMGLNTLFKTQRGIEKLGGTFVMTNIQPQVRKVLEIIKALPSVKIFETMEEADEYLFKIQRDEIENQNKPRE
jgi:anti-sigma B factor antagonist